MDNDQYTGKNRYTGLFFAPVFQFVRFASELKTDQFYLAARSSVYPRFDLLTINLHQEVYSPEGWNSRCITN